MDKPKLACEIMTTRLVTLSPEADVFEAIRLLLRRSITGAPVVNEDRTYLGVFSEKCCMNLLHRMAQLAFKDGDPIVNSLPAREFMVTTLVTLRPNLDVFEAIGYLLKHRISGAPVVDSENNFLGVFSEKTSMRVLLEAAYDQLPTTEVAAFMDTDLRRTIREDTDLLSCARVFLETPYRRLPVLRGRELVGQVSRRDVLRNENLFSRNVKSCRDQHVDAFADIPESTRRDNVMPECLASTAVQEFMDSKARAIGKDADLLTIAQIFLNTPYRRLPVLDGQTLVGQISRRDLLSATHRLLAIAPHQEHAPLYLSSLAHQRESPFA